MTGAGAPARRPPRHRLAGALVERAAERYARADRFSRAFVRSKLRRDPVYLAILESGLLPAGGRLLDLGCGRGLLLSLLAAARGPAGRSVWPERWPAPPTEMLLHGIESRAGLAATARGALDGEATVETADLREARLPACRVAALLDVLHYIPAGEQEPLLRRVHEALEPGGVLLVREADASGGVFFLLTRAAERACAVARGRPGQRFRYRSAGDWTALLENVGFATERRAMDEGTPFANVLIVARRAGAA